MWENVGGEDNVLLTGAEMIFAEATSLEEKFALCQRAGFDGIDLRDSIVHTDLVRALVDRYQMPVAMVYSALPIPLLSETVQQRAQAVELLTEKIRAAGTVGALGLVLVPVFGPARIQVRSISDIRQAEQVVLDCLLTELEPILATSGVYLAIEPLNQTETHLFNSPSAVAQFLGAGPRAGVKTMADTYHMDRERQDMAHEVEASERHLGCIHLSGPDRTLPGPGTIDFARLFRALIHAKYDGPMGYESRPYKTEEITQSVAYVRGLLRQAIG